MTVPAYLQGKPQTARLSDRATQGMGSLIPPHISTRGNTFTLIDASGQEQDAGNTMDVCIVDLGDVMGKQYYEGEWSPDSNDPPTCWSQNGVAPSVDASNPQSRTCAECPQNARGSAISKISGAKIKACRDEVLTAVLHPKFPSMLFQLKVTPGSFKNWQAYVKKFDKQPFDMNDVITKIAFEPKVNGVLTFAGVKHLQDAETIKLRNAALIEKKSDALVGRLDRPRGGMALPAREPQAQLTNEQAAIRQAEPETQQETVSQAPQTARRGRKPKETAAAPVAGTEAPFMAGDSPLGNEPETAGAFGVQAGVAPNAEIEGALKDIFG